MSKREKISTQKKKPILQVEWVFGDIPQEVLNAWILSLHGITPDQKTKKQRDKGFIYGKEK